MGRAPKYQQITEWIQNQIASGELSAGDRLESEHELSARFRLSRQTVRHALSELEEAGIEEGDTVRMYGLQFDYYK